MVVRLEGTTSNFDYSLCLNEGDDLDKNKWFYMISNIGKICKNNPSKSICIRFNNLMDELIKITQQNKYISNKQLYNCSLSNTNTIYPC